MIDNIPLEHHIQKYIMSVLMYQKTARFRDLRPPSTDTNLFAYHLKQLVKNGLVDKCDGGYTLSLRGLAYVDRISTEKFQMRVQPKIITMLVIQNSEGDLLLQKRIKQPYIDTWTLPYGKLHIDDDSIKDAARREASEKLGLNNQPLNHAGDCYIRVKQGDTTLSSTLAHVFRFDSDDVPTGDTVIWVRPHMLHEYSLAPAVEMIAARTFFRDPYFFEEFMIEVS